MSGPVYLKTKSECFDDICRLAYEHSAQSVAQQKQDLRTLRGQAAFVSAVNGLLASFMSNFIVRIGPNLNSEFYGDWNTPPFNVNLETLLAIVCVSGSLALAIRIILPESGWSFDLSPTAMRDNLCYKGKRFKLPDLHTVLSKQLEKDFDGNEILLQKTQSRLLFALVLAFMQIPFWLWNLI